MIKKTVTYRRKSDKLCSTPDHVAALLELVDGEQRVVVAGHEVDVFDDSAYDACVGAHDAVDVAYGVALHRGAGAAGEAYGAWAYVVHVIAAEVRVERAAAVEGERDGCGPACARWLRLWGAG